MMQTKISCWKRLFSFILTLILLLTLLPTSAFAAPQANAKVYNLHKIERTGTTLTQELDRSTTLTPRQNFTYETANDVQNLWVYSSSMISAEQQNGGVIPYVDDKDENRWYLKEIIWANDSSFNGATEEIPLMSSKQIADADSVSDYNVDLSNYEIGAPNEKGRYFIWYVWTQTPPDTSGDEKNYTISYNLNLPDDKNIDSITIIDQDRIEPQAGAGYSNVENAVSNLGDTVKEGINFRVADGLGAALAVNGLKGFLAFNISNPNTTSYYFAGWQDENNTIHAIDEIVTASNDLANGDSTIQFKGVWTAITPWSEEQLAEAEQQVPLNIFTSGEGGNLLITQSTDMLTKENNLISYTVSAGFNGDLLSKDDNVAFKGSDFATFEIIVDVDPNLEFANLNNDGTVTLSMASNLIIPHTIKTNTGSAAWTGSNGNWTVTVDPAALPASESGMQIVINAAFTDQNYKNFADKMTLTGLDFKLKDGVFDNDGVALELETSANMKAKIDLQKIAGPEGIFNARFRFQTLTNLLKKTDANGEVWRSYFGGGEDNPPAYIHALQFLDYKLADYDLNADKTSTLDANTVMVTVVESEPVTITPADITIYEGGVAGYEGVVDENGSTITSSSFPEPLFKINLPEGSGADPKDLTFTNHGTGNSWRVEVAGTDSEGTTYYRLVDTKGSGTPIRVQFIDEFGNVIESDTVATTDEVFDTHTIAIFSGDDDVTATAGQAVYTVSTNTGILTVRAVQSSNATSPIETQAPSSVTPGSATAVAPADGTTYTLNDTGVELPTGSLPSLLFDDIIDTDVNRTSALEDKVDAVLGGADADREYQIKYLDLVDANNGNAWIKSSNGTDIYWGYPTGTDRSTNFTLLHFAGLHRDGENSGFDLGDLANITPKPVKIQKTDAGIKFHVEAGDFSPYALVWTDASTPGTNPGGGSGGGSDNSDPTGNLTISLGGNGGNEDFIFTVIFTDEDGDELENNFYYNGDYTGTIGSGDEITLTGGDKIVIRNLPEGTRYEVIIETADGYTATSTGAEGVIRTSGNEAAFSVTPTVVLADPSVTGVTRWLNTTDHTAYLSGYPGGTFGPDNSMTRAEVAQMFYALLLNKDVTITKTFSDVPADAWYATAVNTLASLGMVSGDPDGAFRPNDPITRAEFCVIALAFAYEPDNAVCYFGDVSRSDWFYTYVAQAASYGWIGGYTNGNFGPNDQITRAQVTTIVNNMLGRAADRDYVIDHQADLVQFSDLTRAHWGYFQIMEATNAHDYTKSGNTEDWTQLN